MFMNKLRCIFYSFSFECSRAVRARSRLRSVAALSFPRKTSDPSQSRFQGESQKHNQSAHIIARNYFLELFSFSSGDQLTEVTSNYSKVAKYFSPDERFPQKGDKNLHENYFKSKLQGTDE